MPTTATPSHASPERSNPLYLMSALSMLGGCYLLNFDLIQGREHLAEITRLVGILQIYEGALLATAAYLFRSARSLRDARTLLVLEVLFLVDATYLLAEAFEFAPNGALALGAATAALTAIKLWALDRGLRLGLQRREWAFLTIAFAALFYLPRHFAVSLRDGMLLPVSLSDAWWLVAALVAFAPAGLTRRGTSPENAPLDRRDVAQTFRLALSVGLVLSLAAHVRAAHYVYEMPTYLAALAPLLLAGAYRLLRDDDVRATSAGRFAIFGLPVLAVALAGKAPPELTRALGDGELTPYRLVMAASAALYLDALRRLHRGYFLAAASAAGFFALLGESPKSLALGAGRLTVDSLRFLIELIPRTVGDWGRVGVGAAFMLLAAGLLLTLARNPRPVKESAHLSKS